MANPSQEEFLATVIKEVAELKEIKDAEEVIKEKHPLIIICAKTALSQLVAYCNRPFIKKDIQEEYSDIETPFWLRMVPVASITEVLLNDIEIASDQYELKRNKLSLSSYESIWLAGGSEEMPDDFTVTVTYNGGYALAENNDTLFNALVLQTIANYHRRDLLGFSDISNERGGNAKSMTDKGGILESVKGLAAPLVYHGEAEEIES
jgi:hypothetical protein